MTVCAHKSVIASLKPDADQLRWGKHCGPPIHKKIVCFRCHKTKGVVWRRGWKRYCKECEPLVLQEQAIASRKVNQAIKYGELPPASSCRCVDCGRVAEQYEHRSYQAPMDVQPVCKSCNTKRGPAKWRRPA